MSGAPGRKPEPIHLMVGAGGIYQSHQVVRTVLGSCVAVVLYSPSLRLGGILHAFMPTPKDESAKEQPFRYVDTGICCMLKDFAMRGVPSCALTAKIFGGACSFSDESVGVGRRNVEMAFRILERCNIQVTASDVGGKLGRKLLFVVENGTVYLKRLPKDKLPPRQKKAVGL